MFDKVKNKKWLYGKEKRKQTREYVKRFLYFDERMRKNETERK